MRALSAWRRLGAAGQRSSGRALRPPRAPVHAPAHAAHALPAPPGGSLGRRRLSFLKAVGPLSVCIISIVLMNIFKWRVGRGRPGKALPRPSPARRRPAGGARSCSRRGLQGQQGRPRPAAPIIGNRLAAAPARANPRRPGIAANARPCACWLPAGPLLLLLLPPPALQVRGRRRHPGPPQPQDRRRVQAAVHRADRQDPQRCVAPAARAGTACWAAGGWRAGGGRGRARGRRVGRRCRRRMAGAGLSSCRRPWPRRPCLRPAGMPSVTISWWVPLINVGQQMLLVSRCPSGACHWCGACGRGGRVSCAPWRPACLPPPPPLPRASPTRPPARPPARPPTVLPPGRAHLLHRHLRVDLHRQGAGAGAGLAVGSPIPARSGGAPAGAARRQPSAAPSVASTPPRRRTPLPSCTMPAEEHVPAGCQVKCTGPNNALLPPNTPSSGPQKNKYQLNATQELRGLGLANLLGAMFNACEPRRGRGPWRRSVGGSGGGVGQANCAAPCWPAVTPCTPHTRPRARPPLPRRRHHHRLLLALRRQRLRGVRAGAGGSEGQERGWAPLPGVASCPPARLPDAAHLTGAWPLAPCPQALPLLHSSCVAPQRQDAAGQLCDGPGGDADAAGADPHLHAHELQRAGAPPPPLLPLPLPPPEGSGGRFGAGAGPCVSRMAAVHTCPLPSSRHPSQPISPCTHSATFAGRARPASWAVGPARPPRSPTRSSTARAGRGQHRGRGGPAGFPSLLSAAPMTLRYARAGRNHHRGRGGPAGLPRVHLALAHQQVRLARLERGLPVHHLPGGCTAARSAGRGAGGRGRGLSRRHCPGGWWVGRRLLGGSGRLCAGAQPAGARAPQHAPRACPPAPHAPRSPPPGVAAPPPPAPPPPQGVEIGIIVSVCVSLLLVIYKVGGRRKGNKPGSASQARGPARRASAARQQQRRSRAPSRRLSWPHAPSRPPAALARASPRPPSRASPRWASCRAPRSTGGWAAGALALRAGSQQACQVAGALRATHLGRCFAHSRPF